MKGITIIKRFVLLQILWISACSTTNQVGNEIGLSIENPEEEYLKELIGKKVTFTGKTINMKLGAVLILENGQSIYMDKMLSWPNGYYVKDNEEKETIKTVKVTGILKEKNDMPVFIRNENDSTMRQGIPMPKGTDLKKASYRYLLKDYKWVEIK